MFQTEIQESSATTPLTVSRGLWYDAERLVLEGFYGDEVTAFRAKKRWIEVLESNFLLERGIDFSVAVADERVPVTPMLGGCMGEPSETGTEFRYSVRCDFLSACGRYAFWRITHHQAPQVQCLLESAHLAKPTLVRVDTLPALDDGWSYPSSKLEPPKVDVAETAPSSSGCGWLRSHASRLIKVFAVWRPSR